MLEQEKQLIKDDSERTHKRIEKIKNEIKEVR
jgi:hypothetical protein